MSFNRSFAVSNLVMFDFDEVFVDSDIVSGNADGNSISMIILMCLGITRCRVKECMFGSNLMTGLWMLWARAF